MGNKIDFGVERQVFTTDEVAQILGFHKETVRRYIRINKLKAVRSGMYYRVSRPDLESFWKSFGGGKLF